MKSKILFLLYFLPLFIFAHTSSNSEKFSIETTMAAPPTGALSGVYYIGTSGDFTTLTSAVEHLNTKGVSGAVTFLLDKETFSTTNGEVFPITINAISGASATKTITFKPAPNRNVNVIGENINPWTPVTALFKFNGAKHIVFNGSNNNTDTVNLFFKNNCNLDYSNRTVIWLTNASNYITLKNTSLKQGFYNADYAFSGAIFAGDNNTVGAQSNNPVSNLEVSNNVFLGVKQGVYIANNEANFSSNITVIDNDFGTDAGVDKITHSIYVRGVKTFNIQDNIIYDLDVTFSGGEDFGGIYIGGNSTDGKIHRNKILGIDRQTNHLIAGIKLSSESNLADVKILVANNFVANVRSQGGGSWNQSGYGIFAEKGKGYKIYHNTVNMSQNQATGFTAALMIVNASNLDVRNNIFINNQTDAGNSSYKAAIAINGTPAFSTVFSNLDNNNYWVNPSQIRSFIGAYGSLTWQSVDNPAYKKTLANWKVTSTAPRDLNSGTENTPFVSNFNLHVTNDNAWVNDKGVNLSAMFGPFGIPYQDIDGQSRSTTTPDIGADEFGMPDKQACATTLYWNGTSWTNASGNVVPGLSTPNKNTKTELIAAYDTQTNGSFATCELKISAGGSLRINANDYVYIVNRFINKLAANAVIVENNGSIIQETDFNQNQGSITYKRNSLPMHNYDFTYWGSPVTGETTAQFSPTSGNKSSYRWDPTIDGNQQKGWKTHTGVMEQGHGYIIKAPSNFPSNAASTPQVFQAVFEGTPNSGTYTFETTGDIDDQLPGVEENNPLDGYPQGEYAWNFFGNPYPSAIDVVKFYNDNNMVLESNVYLWTHNTKPVYGNNSYNYVANDFAVYNVKLRTGTAATPYVGGGTTINPNYNTPTRYIASGQGFFIAAKQGIVQFSNSMRVSNINNGQNGFIPNDRFYRLAQTTENTLFAAEQEDSNQDEAHILKLSIRNTQGAFHQTMLAYAAGASNGEDDFDGAMFGGNFVSIYTLSNNKGLVVQGRALPFDDTDEVAVGLNLTISGDFSINLDYFDGLFAAENQSQEIYLKDSLLNLMHNLKEGPYEFYSDLGSVNDRFTLVYRTALGVEDVILQDNWSAYPKAGNLEVASKGFDMASIMVYDMLGRVIYENQNLNTSMHSINMAHANQVLIIKITSTENKTSVKKVIY